MGISHHPFHFLLYVSKKQKLGNVVTLGRQNLSCAESIVRDRLKISGPYTHARYCEQLLMSHMSATNVDSVDNSDFEGASHIHDMNRQIPEDMKSKYDTVIDSGTTEHIYNVSEALANCSALCKPGGQIVHISPSNNLCGHGFWQFSPELFFSLYFAENGYEQTEVFVADKTNFKHWAQVRRPQGGQRAIINSATPLYVMARSRKKTSGSAQPDVQQSDYSFRWNIAGANDCRPAGELRAQIEEFVRTSPRFQRAFFPFYKLHYKLNKRFRRDHSFSNKNPHLAVARISSFLETVG